MHATCNQLLGNGHPLICSPAYHHQDLADAFIARHKRMVTFLPSTVRAMVHLFQKLTDDQEANGTEAEEYYMVGVDLVVPSVYPEQEGIAAGGDEVRIVVKNWMTANEMAVLVRIALLEIGNVGIISKSEWLLCTTHSSGSISKRPRPEMHCFGNSVAFPFHILFEHCVNAYTC